MKNEISEESVWIFFYKNISFIELALLLVFLYITYLAINDLRYARDTMLWPKVNGTIKAINKVKKHHEDNLEIAYEYQVDDKKLSNNIIAIDEYLSKAPEGHQSINDLIEPPPLTFLKNFRRIINGKASNLTLIYHYIFSYFPVFATQRTELISQYKPGDVIPIYHAPRKPEVSLVKPGSSTPFYIILGINVFLLLVFLRRIIVGIYFALGTTSFLLKVTGILFLFVWVIAPLSLFIYLTGMFHATIKSIK